MGSNKLLNFSNTILMVNHNKKLIVFDTDGVIFKSQLLLRISRSAGILNLMRTRYLCLRFSVNIINIRELLDRVYVMFRGLTGEGSVVLFLTALACAFFYLPLMTALIVSAVSCIIVALPIEFDNISIPLGTGLFLGLII